MPEKKLRQQMAPLHRMHKIDERFILRAGQDDLRRNVA
jgi:hypothetical protein